MDSVDLELENVSVENTHPVLQNEYICEHLFRFLSIKDVKSCRQVNTLWRDVGSRFLRKKGIVVFDFYRGKPAMKQTEAKMAEITKHCLSDEIELANTPFRTFIFKREIRMSLLENFVKKVDWHMRKLCVIPAIISKTGKKELELNSLIGPNLNSLVFHFANRGKPSTTAFHLSLSVTLLLNELVLDNCEIRIGKYENRISVTKLSLGKNITYTRNKEELETVALHEVVNFRRTTKIKIEGVRDGRLVLDFAECGNETIKRDVVNLKNIKVVNWEKCNWVTKVFSLKRIPFLQNNCLHFEIFLITETEFDLSKIHNPPMVKKLVLRNKVRGLAIPFVLPNIVELTLIGLESIPHLVMFSQLESIKTLCLANHCTEMYMSEFYAPVEFIDLPKNVERLYLDKVFIDGDASEIYPLTALKFIGHPDRDSVQKLRKTLLKVQPKNLIYYDRICKGRQLRKLTTFVKDEVFMNDSIRVFSVGNILWNRGMEFQNSEFSQLVNRKAKWYDFKRDRIPSGRGRRNWRKYSRLPLNSILRGKF